MNISYAIAAGCLLLVACGTQEPAGAPNADIATNAILPEAADPAKPTVSVDNATPAHAADAWIGKWVGVEGLALEIARGQSPGQYRLKVSLMDGTTDYVGTAAGDTIRFTRDGVEETIRKATGDETGLKWLAGKQDCLMIKPAEGFCRD